VADFSNTERTEGFRVNTSIRRKLANRKRRIQRSEKKGKERDRKRKGHATLPLLRSGKVACPLFSLPSHTEDRAAFSFPDWKDSPLEVMAFPLALNRQTLAKTVPGRPLFMVSGCRTRGMAKDTDSWSRSGAVRQSDWPLDGPLVARDDQRSFSGSVMQLPPRREGLSNAPGATEPMDSTIQRDTHGN
jgi:hypothetical protein